MIENFWAQPADTAIKFLNSDFKNGLSISTVEEARKKYGSNTIEEIKPARAWELILDGVREPMMIVLLAIGGLSLLFGKTGEAIVMIFVVAAYVSVEFINKYRTDRTMTRLKRLTSLTARVIREGWQQDIKTDDIVCGDILIFAEGSRIPADARLLESFGLFVDEASLTGESLPVEKNAAFICDSNAQLADQRNMLFASTIVLSGEGRAVVTAVGMKSELGKIAKAITKEKKEKTALQEAMTKLAKILTFFAIGVSLLIPAVGFARGLDLQAMIMTWLALTFLMVPGQPPIIITMALALASFKLAKIKLVVKRLRGVESLSAVTAIVTDKTGTITENKMRVESFILPNGEKILPRDLSVELKHKILHALPRYGNDPTDEAVRAKVSDSLEQEKAIGFIGFTDDHPWRAIAYESNGNRIEYLAGKVENLIALTKTEVSKKLKDAIQREADDGKRIVAYGCSERSRGAERSSVLAFAVLSDPIRASVAKTLVALNNASVKTFIVTGDHPTTTQAIARELGLNARVVTGTELDAMSDSMLIAALNEASVFARISPSQKLRIVETLERNGEVVAVIGDGANDAPALKTANVGIAMGEIGTDLAKETADLILTDDDYSHIFEAIGIARCALDNFRKGLTYYLTAKSILLTIFIIPLMLGIQFPFAPIHIIMIELLMDLASSTIFVTEIAEPDVLKKGVRKLKQYLGKELILRIIKNGFWFAFGIISLYLFVYYELENPVLAQTSAFVTWLLGHILLALNLKQEKLPLIKQGIFSNHFGMFWLLGMIALSIIITVFPGLHFYLKTSSLPIQLWLAIVIIIFTTTFWIEIIKITKWKEYKII